MKRRPWGALVVGALSAALISGMATAPARGDGTVQAGAEAHKVSAVTPTLTPVTVTVTIESVSPLGELDLSIIDAEVVIDQEAFIGAPAFPASIGDTIRPAWRFTKQVDPSRAVFEDSIPIRIRVYGSSPQLPIGHLQVDVDPYECRAPQCAYVDSGGHPRTSAAWISGTTWYRWPPAERLVVGRRDGPMVHRGHVVLCGRSASISRVATSPFRITTRALRTMATAI